MQHAKGYFIALCQWNNLFYTSAYKHLSQNVKKLLKSNHPYVIICWFTVEIDIFGYHQNHPYFELRLQINLAKGSIESFETWMSRERKKLLVHRSAKNRSMRPGDNLKLVLTRVERYLYLHMAYALHHMKKLIREETSHLPEQASSRKNRQKEFRIWEVDVRNVIS